MGLRATKKQNRYKNTLLQGLVGSVAVLWRLSGHNPRDQDKRLILTFPNLLEGGKKVEKS